MTLSFSVLGGLYGLGDLFKVASLFAAASVLIYSVGWLIYARTLHPYADIPGPFWASVSRLWIAYMVESGDVDKVLVAVHKKYGRMVRIAPDEVSIGDPEAIKIIYSVSSGFTKTDFYDPFATHMSPHPDLFSARDEKEHAERRRLVNNAYSMSSILESETYIDECSQLFIQRMGEYADSGQNFDFGMWLQMYAFDVVGTLFFGKMFGFMETRSDYGAYITSLDSYLPVLATNFVLPDYLRSVRPFLANLGLKRIRDAILSIVAIRQAASDVVTTRTKELQEGKVGRTDILQKLFNVQQGKGADGHFLLADIEQESYVAIFAGSDTTAIAMRSILYFLMKNPKYYKKLQDEIDEATARGELSTPTVRFSEASKLPYLIACCKEGMRMHPSVGFTLPRTVPAGGKEISGRYFPAGSKVGIYSGVIHLDKSIFGDDADVFNPDRWIEGDAANMDRYMFQVRASCCLFIAVC
ncbi:cytochrome P450 [Exophiala viscosa]|uniref:cytochrome P450 n=1 Tax=Exophiala viscosa TaxID=2486360 RepID=UPI0021966032|nr:cytochrome P450 [Exophiala viscosa]